MNKILLVLVSLLFFNSLNSVSQNSDWIPSEYPQLESKMWKIDGKIKYFVDSTMDISTRNEIIHKTKEYIADNLKFINETSFDDSLYLIIIRDRNEMEKYVGGRFAGITYIKDEIIPVNHIYSIYKKGDNPLKHELMHLVSLNKWGKTTGAFVSWLSEGLAMLADPSLDNCEDHTFEEKYVYFLQNNKLLSAKELIFSMHDFVMPELKIFYAQSACIVDYLLRHYGMDKVKQQWISRIERFEEIFGLSFDELIIKINNELNQKYPNAIEFDWEKFNQRSF